MRKQRVILFVLLAFTLLNGLYGLFLLQAQERNTPDVKGGFRDRYFTYGTTLPTTASSLAGDLHFKTAVPDRGMWRAYGADLWMYIDNHDISAIPTIGAGAGLGTGSPVVSVTAASTDSGGSVTLTPGTTPTADAVLATVTFGQAFTLPPRAVILTPANAAAAALAAGASGTMPYISAISTTTFTIRSNAVALPAGTYLFWYQTSFK